MIDPVKRFIQLHVVCTNISTGTIDQLNLMGAIYANAVITTIAADTDSQEGILGLKDVSPPHGLNQRVYPFGKERILMRNTNLFSLEHGGTPYFNRGWTYQELKMSQRKLFFLKQELHWQCSCSIWHEELMEGQEIDKYIDPRLGVILAGFPDLESLNNILLSHYNERQLTFEEDALPAIAGLLSVTSRSFPGGFLYGHPEFFFSTVL